MSPSSYPSVCPVQEPADRPEEQPLPDLTHLPPRLIYETHVQISGEAQSRTVPPWLYALRDVRVRQDDTSGTPLLVFLDQLRSPSYSASDLGPAERQVSILICCPSFSSR